MIAQGFGFTRDFLKERNNSAYCRLKKIPCEFKEQARARHPGEKCGLGACFPDSTVNLPDFEDKVKPYFKRWELATKEDNTICELQQLGQKFNREPGRFSSSEFALHDMSNWLLDQLLGN